MKKVILNDAGFSLPETICVLALLGSDATVLDTDIETFPMNAFRDGTVLGAPGVSLCQEFITRNTPGTFPRERSS